MNHFAAANTLYFSDLLPAAAPQLWQQLTTVLQEYAIPYYLLPLTRDIWAIDYMPVQLSRTDFVQFRYDPSYLKPKKYATKRTDAAPVLKALFLPIATQCPLRLDGGNVVWIGPRAIITDRIFSENPGVPPSQLCEQFRQALQAEIIIIPADAHDFTGHADGMVQALDEQTVLVNDYHGKDAALGRQVTAVLQNAGLTVIPFPYFPSQSGSYSSAVGTYINFVRIGPLVLLPVFDHLGDEAAVYQAEQLFPQCKVVPVKMNELAPLGGLLHCITWAIDLPGASALPSTLPNPVGHSYYSEPKPHQSWGNTRQPNRPLDRRDRYRGSLLGATYGDALAVKVTAAGPPTQATAVTQLMLFTAEGLLRAAHRAMQKGIGGAAPQIVWESWLRWLHTQGINRQPEYQKPAEWPGGWLSRQPALQHSRQPAPTTLQALTTSPPHPPQPAANNSMGADPLVRVVPIGLLHFHSAASTMEQAAHMVAFTHGHQVAQAAAGWVAATIALLLQGNSLVEAARVAYHLLSPTTEAGHACRHALDMALDLHQKPTNPLADDYLHFMAVRTAPAALAGALYHALQFQAQPATALAKAAQVGGRSTAALTGALLGAQAGEAIWPTDWVHQHDLANLTLALADDLFIGVKGDSFTLDEEWWARYPGY